MKQFLTAVMSGIVILTACAPPETATPVFVTQEATTSPIPTSTNTSFPTATPTTSITPLPTIPTFTPTFDASTIVTVTPAPKAECPRVNPDLAPTLNTFFNTEGLTLLIDEAVLDFLNSGGPAQKLITAFRQKYNWLDSNVAIQQDITGDEIAELVLTDGYVVYVFGCKDKQYQTLLSQTDDPAWMQEIQFNIVEDMNLNGIPELITVEHGGHTYTSIKVSLFEWIGQEFLPLIQGRIYKDNQYFTFADTSVPAHVTVYDSDRNSTLELVLVSDLPTPVPPLYSYLIPWRNETKIYAWNGTHYILNRVEYTSPEFRFQGVQDADREVSYGNFNEALLIYQDVISSNKLKAFSPEIAENEIVKLFATEGHQPAPTSVPPDPAEYPRLAAYAYYRIMLVHLVQGNETEAETGYKTLQEKYGSDPYGQPYLEMATAFWDTYQSTHKMYDGCAAAIQYAAEHPEILIPLGSDYHGSQSHIYVPADVCPFR